MAKRKRSGKQVGAPNAATTKRARVDGEIDAPAVKVPTETDILLSDRSLFADDLSRADHDRERRLYQLLGSCDPEDRIRAGDVIIMALLGKQGDEEEIEESEEAEGTEETEETQETEETKAKDERERVSESVLMRHLERRLLRGLATSNEASRVGFSYVLSEMLGRLFGRRDVPPDEAAATAAKYAEVYPKITFDRVLDLLIEKTTTGSSVPGQEQRDHHWGRLFGLMSFVESGILFGPGDEGRVRRWDSVLEHLLQLSHKVVWLRSYAFYVIAQAILRGQLPAHETVAATLRAVAADTTSGASLAKTPEGLGIWLAALTRFPDMALPAPWTQPLAPASHKDVVAVLRSGGSGGEDDESKALKQGNATPQLHFVWNLILGELLSTSAKRFDGFWIAVVDQVYFAKGATDHQKLTGFKVFQKALALCAASAAAAAEDGVAADGIPPSMFSNNLMACLMNQASNPTPRLHRTAVSVLRDIEFQVEETPQALVSVLTGLLGAVPQAHGVYDFDERVKGTGDGTKPVEHILRFANSDNVEDVIGLLRAGALQARDPKNDQRPVRMYAEYLFRLVSRPIGASDEPEPVSVSGTAFKALAELAYRADDVEEKDRKKDSKKDSKKNKKKTPTVTFPTLTDKTQASARQYLLSAAGAILKRPDDLASFCRTVYGIDPAAVGVAMTDEIKVDVVDARKQLKTLAAAFKVEAKSSADASARASQGLAVLLAVSLLQLYHEPRADAIDVLHDIKACGDKLASGSTRASAPATTKGDGSDSDDDDDDEAEPDIGQVLTDVLLSLLAESSQLTRQTSLLVFEAFAPFMSAEALDNLADVLSAEENTSGYRALFNPDDGEEEEDEDDSDLEMLDMEGGGGDDEEEEEDDDDDEGEEGEEDEDEDDEDEEEEEDDEDEEEKKTPKEAKTKDDKPAKKAPVLKDDDSFEAALMKTFNSSVGAPKPDDDDDSDDDSDNESDMDDDAMLALDNALAGHLALIRDKTDSHKKEREEARTRVVQFKHRVLDLLEVYIRAGAGAGDGNGDGNGNSVLLFRLFLPLAVLVRETKDKSLAQKATRVVQKLKLQLKRRRSQTQAPAASSTAASIDASLAVLSSLHAAANDRTENKAFAAAVSAASLAISSTLLWMAVTERDAADAEKKKDSRHKVFLRVAAIYDATKAHCAADGWNVRKELFTDYNNWCQTTVHAAE